MLTSRPSAGDGLRLGHVPLGCHTRARPAAARGGRILGSLVDALYEVGISGQDRIVGINQGWKLSGAIKTAERKPADRTLVHGGQRLMALAVGNARGATRQCDRHYKASIRDGKIDPLMAALNAVAWMSSIPASSLPRTL